MFQKGPGEGYMAAKADVLAVCPKAYCNRKESMGIRGYVVYLPCGKYDDQITAIGSGANARDAWNDALGWIKRNKSNV